MMKTGKNNRFLAGILAASMMLTMSPFAQQRMKRSRKK